MRRMSSINAPFDVVNSDPVSPTAELLSAFNPMNGCDQIHILDAKIKDYESSSTHSLEADSLAGLYYEGAL